MSPTLKQGLKIFFEISLEFDFIPVLQFCNPRCEDCVLVTNPKTKKIGLIGLGEDTTGVEKVALYTINIKKWEWAEDEGFTIEDILEDDKICDAIFEFVDLQHFAQYLSLKSK